MTLAIVGGSGRLPDMLADTVPDALRFAPLSVAFGCGLHEAMSFRFERLGELIDQLRDAGVRQIVFAGAMRRPVLDPTALDAFTADAMAVLGPAMARGDDALLRSVMGVFEREGFDVVAAHAVRPGLVPSPGVLTTAQPEDGDGSDAERGLAILDALAPFDVGQACAVAAGQVLAIESMGGTDWMLGILAGEVPGRLTDRRNGVLCKAPKRGQDRRIDLPTIGPATVTAASAAGLRGIVVQAGGVLVLDRAEAVAKADEAGMFLWVRAS